MQEESIASMREIGGYLELETFQGEMLHGNGIKLNSGRNCLAYIIKSKGIKRLLMPSLMCDSVFEVCNNYGVEMRYYPVHQFFLPNVTDIREKEYLYLMNYYGQLSSATITYYRDRYERVIIDNTQDYFADPVSGVDTLYSCRKFFGVADGGILFTDVKLNERLDQSESFDRMEYLLGRFERSAEEFFAASIQNNERIANQPIKKMSKITYNMLHGLNYQWIRRKRTENYKFLHNRLSDVNMLSLRDIEGAFAYPLLISNGAHVKEKLREHRVYVPTLWPNVIQQAISTNEERCFVSDLLPLPCDQRYGIEEMKYISDLVISMGR